MTLETACIVTSMFIVSISDKINNERRWNKKWRWALYLAYTHILPPDLERDCTRPGQGLYVCLSNLQAIVTLLQFSDSPLPTPFFFLHQNPLPLSSTPTPSPPPRFCSSLSSSPPLRVLLSPLPPLPLSRQHERRAACIPGHPFLEQTACPLFPHVRTPRRENYLRFHLSFLPAPPSPACLFFFLPSFLSLMGANEWYSIWKQPTRIFLPGWVLGDYWGGSDKSLRIRRLNYSGRRFLGFASVDGLGLEFDLEMGVTGLMRCVAGNGGNSKVASEWIIELRRRKRERERGGGREKEWPRNVFRYFCLDR